MVERRLPVVQTQGNNSAPKAVVFTGLGRIPLTPTEIKRTRFVHNLRENYRRLKEALQFVEHFAAVCELSPNRIEAIQRAHQDALKELTLRFTRKIEAYDARIQGVNP